MFKVAYLLYQLCISAVFAAYSPWSAVVGILGTPPRQTLRPAYVPEVLVEFLESAGIQVVPLNYSDPNLKDLLSRINGVVFPDGNIDVTSTHPYVQTANKIYNYALKRHSENRPFPLIGFCQGHQILAALAAQNTDVIAKRAYETGNVALTLQFIGNGGKMLGSLPSNVQQILKTQPVTPNMHANGVPPEMWSKSRGLKEQFLMTSTSLDQVTKKTFSATMESVPGMAPMYGLQWHPEAIPYLWDRHFDQALVKTIDSLQVSHAFSLFFASVFSGMRHRFANDGALGEAIVRNYKRKCQDVAAGQCYYII